MSLYVTCSGLQSFQGFFGSLREEFIMKMQDISVTICTIGGVDTENSKRAVLEFKPEIVSKYPTPANPSETALYIIKGGAQRWKTVKYPKADTLLLIDLYYFMPETVAALFRFMFS